MSWRDILKDASAVKELEDMMSKPMPSYKGLKATLVNIQRNYPMIFSANENVADMNQMVQQMIDEAEAHYRVTRQLGVKKLEEQLRSVSDSINRLQELE